MTPRALTGSLAGRIILLLAGAILVANIAALGVMSLQRESDGQQARDEREIERISALVPALEAVDVAARTRIAREASTRFARVRVSPQPALTETAADARSRSIARQLAQRLERPDIAVALIDPDPGHPRGPDRRAFFRLRTLVVTVPLSPRDGRAAWLNVVTQTPPRGAGRDEDRFPLIILAASLAAVLIVSVILARLLTKPLGQLSRAARAAGRGDHTARVPETGPREMREAAAAFNAMQSEIARFDAERMRLIASVGHDLRTPITGLRIRAEMLDDAEQREAMIRTLDEMTVMAEGLVSYGREGHEPEEMAQVNLADLLTRLCEERGATCTSLPDLHVRARPVGLTRAIGNLVENAVRYGGGAEVSLRAAGGNAIITIEDNGPGIPPARLDEMFRPFTRGEASRNADTGGSGLGLSIARTIITAQGGTLTLQNRAEGGLRARVSLPLRETD